MSGDEREGLREAIAKALEGHADYCDAMQRDSGLTHMTSARPGLRDAATRIRDGRVDLSLLPQAQEPVGYRVDQRPTWRDDLTWETLRYFDTRKGAEAEVRKRVEADYGPEYRIVPLYASPVASAPEPKDHAPKHDRDEILRLIAEGYPYEDRDGTTHWEGCWRERGHHNCAVEMVERLTQAQERVDAPPNAIRPESVWADGTVRRWWVDDGDGPKVVGASPSSSAPHWAGDADDPMCGRCGHDPRECEPGGSRTVSRASAPEEEREREHNVVPEPRWLTTEVARRAWKDGYAEALTRLRATQREGGEADG